MTQKRNKPELARQSPPDSESADFAPESGQKGSAKPSPKNRRPKLKQLPRPSRSMQATMDRLGRYSDKCRDLFSAKRFNFDRCFSASFREQMDRVRRIQAKALRAMPVIPTAQRLGLGAFSAKIKDLHSSFGARMPSSTDYAIKDLMADRLSTTAFHEPIISFDGVRAAARSVMAVVPAAETLSMRGISSNMEFLNPSTRGCMANVLGGSVRDFMADWSPTSTLREQMGRFDRIHASALRTMSVGATLNSPDLRGISNQLNELNFANWGPAFSASCTVKDLLSGHYRPSMALGQIGRLNEFQDSALKTINALPALESVRMRGISPLLHQEVSPIDRRLIHALGQQANAAVTEMQTVGLPAVRQYSDTDLSGASHDARAAALRHMPLQESVSIQYAKVIEQLPVPTRIDNDLDLLGLCEAHLRSHHHCKVNVHSHDDDPQAQPSARCLELVGHVADTKTFNPELRKCADEFCSLTRFSARDVDELLREIHVVTDNRGHRSFRIDPFVINLVPIEEIGYEPVARHRIRTLETPSVASAANNQPLKDSDCSGQLASLVAAIVESLRTEDPSLADTVMRQGSKIECAQSAAHVDEGADPAGVRILEIRSRLSREYNIKPEQDVYEATKLDEKLAEFVLAQVAKALSENLFGNRRAASGALFSFRLESPTKHQIEKLTDRFRLRGLRRKPK